MYITFFSSTCFKYSNCSERKVGDYFLPQFLVLILSAGLHSKANCATLMLEAVEASMAMKPRKRTILHGIPLTHTQTAPNWKDHKKIIIVSEVTKRDLAVKLCACLIPWAE
jgi:hypothetical protein